MLEIEFDTTTEEDTVDIRSVKKLEELWKSLDGRNFDKNIFEEQNSFQKNNNFVIVQNFLKNNKTFVKNSKHISQFIKVAQDYILAIKKYNGQVLLDNCDLEILLTWIFLSLWCQSIISLNNNFSFPIFLTIYGYLCIEYKKKNQSNNEYLKFVQFCYKRLCGKEEPYDELTINLNYLLEEFESKYPRENYLMVYNRIIYLLKLRMKKDERGEEKFPYNNIEKGYAIFDTLLFMLLIESPEEIDQEKQNFFSLFGMYIKILFDIKFYKSNKVGFFNLYIRNGLKLDTCLIRLINIIKIMDNYLENSKFIDSNIKNYFISICINLLYYSIYEHSKHISVNFLHYLEKLSFLHPEKFKDLLNQNIINSIKAILIL